MLCNAPFKDAKIQRQGLAGMVRVFSLMWTRWTTQTHTVRRLNSAKVNCKQEAEPRRMKRLVTTVTTKDLPNLDWIYHTSTLWEYWKLWDWQILKLIIINHDNRFDIVWRVWRSKQHQTCTEKKHLFFRAPSGAAKTLRDAESEIEGGRPGIHRNPRNRIGVKFIF